VHAFVEKRIVALRQSFTQLTAQIFQLAAILQHHLFSLRRLTHRLLFFSWRTGSKDFGMFDDFEDEATVGTANLLEEVVGIHPILLFLCQIRTPRYGTP